jgi:hypothetical protein
MPTYQFVVSTALGVDLGPDRPPRRPGVPGSFASSKRSPPRRTPTWSGSTGRLAARADGEQRGPSLFDCTNSTEVTL